MLTTVKQAGFVICPFRVQFHEITTDFDLIDYLYFNSVLFGHLRTKTPSDGLSVPRAIENLIERYGKYLRAGILHDGAFRKFLERLNESTQEWEPWLLTEQESNQLIDEALKSLGCPWIERELIYRSLQLFGWKAFDEDRHAPVPVG